MRTRALQSLANRKFEIPHVSINQNPEGVWQAFVTDFACAQGFQIHGQTRAFVVKATVAALKALPEFRR
jgi:hypothetical protein